jgi:hypothetical protein
MDQLQDAKEKLERQVRIMKDARGILRNYLLALDPELNGTESPFVELSDMALVERISGRCNIGRVIRRA